MLTLEGVKTACRKAYDEKRLLAQHPELPYCYQTEDNKFGCAIGVALTPEVADELMSSEFGGATLGSYGVCRIIGVSEGSDLHRDLYQIQDAHDDWKHLENERHFVWTDTDTDTDTDAEAIKSSKNKFLALIEYGK